MRNLIELQKANEEDIRTLERKLEEDPDCRWARELLKDAREHKKKIEALTSWTKHLIGDTGEEVGGT